MKMHKTVVDKLVRVFELYGGRQNNDKLVRALTELDLSLYTQRENPQKDSFLVLTEDLQSKPR